MLIVVKQPQPFPLIMANALSSLAPQLLALLSLGASQFGLFSLVYIVYAFGVSVTHSVVCDAWLRQSRDSANRPSVIPHASEWSEYSGALLSVVTLFGAAAGTVALISSKMDPFALISIVSVSLALYRVGSRYFEVRIGHSMVALRSDLVMVIGTVGCAAIISLLGFPFDSWSLHACWAFGGFAAMLAAKKPVWRSKFGIVTWIQRRRREIAPLLGESLLMDLGALGAPLLLLPVLSLTSFGIYRGVSNVAAPVRLALNPLRPILASGSHSALIRLASTARIGTASVGMGSGAGIALYFIGKLELHIGVLYDLSAFWPLVALYVSSNMFGHYWYLVARLHSSARLLFALRVQQTILSLAGPLVGGYVFDLRGALIGLSGATFLSAFMWMIGVRIQRSGTEGYPQH